MSISSVFRSDYKKCSFDLPSGNKVKVHVKKDLLSTTGEIAGVLRLNGTNIYLPKGEIITIGNMGKANSGVGVCSAAKKRENARHTPNRIRSY